jgi:hypothetical protein
MHLIYLASGGYASPRGVARTAREAATFPTLLEAQRWADDRRLPCRYVIVRVACLPL